MMAHKQGAHAHFVGLPSLPQQIPLWLSAAKLLGGTPLPTKQHSSRSAEFVIFRRRA